MLPCCRHVATSHLGSSPRTRRSRAVGSLDDSRLARPARSVLLCERSRRLMSLDCGCRFSPKDALPWSEVGPGRWQPMSGSGPRSTGLHQALWQAGPTQGLTIQTRHHEDTIAALGLAGRAVDLGGEPADHDVADTVLVQNLSGPLRLEAGRRQLTRLAAETNAFAAGARTEQPERTRRPRPIPASPNHPGGD